jgi:hypothetical protein
VFYLILGLVVVGLNGWGIGIRRITEAVPDPRFCQDIFRPKIEPRPPGRPRSEQALQEILETAYKLLRDKGFNAVGSHEIAQVAGVSSATLYRWWKSKEEILFDACFEHMKPVLAIPETGSALTRLRR